MLTNKQFKDYQNPLLTQWHTNVEILAYADDYSSNAIFNDVDIQYLIIKKLEQGPGLFAINLRSNYEKSHQIQKHILGHNGH